MQPYGGFGHNHDGRYLEDQPGTVEQYNLAFGTATQQELEQHASYPAIHHDRYSNQEAVSAVKASNIHGNYSFNGRDLIGSGGGRALVTFPENYNNNSSRQDTIVLNFSGDYSGGVEVGSEMWVQGSRVLTQADESGLSVNYADQAGNANLLDGTTESSFAKLAQNERVTGNWTFDSPVSLSDNSLTDIETLHFSKGTDVEAEINYHPGSGQGLLVMDNRRQIELALDGSNMRYQAIKNPVTERPLFQVLSAGGSKRLNVDHEGSVTTTNDIMQVGDGSGSNGARYIYGYGPTQTRGQSGGIVAYDVNNNSNRLV